MNEKRNKSRRLSSDKEMRVSIVTCTPLHKIYVSWNWMACATDFYYICGRVCELWVRTNYDMYAIDWQEEMCVCAYAHSVTSNYYIRFFDLSELCAVGSAMYLSIKLMIWHSTRHDTWFLYIFYFCQILVDSFIVVLKMSWRPKIMNNK